MAESTKEVAYAITADGAGFIQTMERVAAASQGATANIKSQFNSIGEAFEKVQKQLLLITSIVAGGAFFKEAITETVKLTGETMNLSKRLGITAEEASTLNTALGDIYSDSETYIGAFDKFAKTLKKDEQGLNDMGLQTRDTNGNLRDSNTLFREAIEEVGKYAPGLDQTTAAMSLFGKSVDDVMKLQKLTNSVLEEAKEKNEALGLTVTKEGVEGAKKYKAAMNDVGDVLMAVQKAVGDAVMPVFTELANYFASSGPYVVNLFKGALTGLLVVFRTVQGAVQTLVAVVSEAINMEIDQLGNFSELMAALFRGDFSAAGDAWERMKSRTVQGINNVVQAGKDAFNDAQQNFSADVSRVWDKGTPMGAPKGGTKRMGAMPGGAAAGGDKSQMGGMEAELAEMKLGIAEKARAEGTFREMSKQEELAYWKGKLQTVGLSSADELSIRKKVAEEGLAIDKQSFEQRIESLKTERDSMEKNYAERITIATTAYDQIAGKYGAESKEAIKAYGDILDERRKLAEQSRQLDAIAADARRAKAETEIQIERISVQEQLDLGLMSQSQGIARERVFEEQLYAIKREALQERLALVNQENDPATWAMLYQQQEEAERQHQVRMAQIKSAANTTSMSPIVAVFKTAEQSISTAIQGIINRTMTLRQAMASIWKGISQSIIKEIANILAKKVAAWATEKALTMAGIGADATKAGSGAAASVANVPYVGPVLAIAALAAVFGAVMGMKSNVPSAAGGFDIPSSVNPITQLHEREMVLPAKHADVIRNMADNGLSGSGGVNVTIAAHPMPGNYFMVHRSQLVEAMQSARRDFALR